MPSSHELDSLATLADWRMQRLLVKLDFRTLIAGLRGAGTKAKDKVLKNLSEHVGKLIEDGLKSRAPKATDVKRAREEAECCPSGQEA